MRIKEHPDYLISMDGTVVSLKRMRAKILKPILNDKGYLIVGLDGKNKNIHRLVLESFGGKCPEGMECCHIDGNRLNNNLENLKWDTHAENMKDKIKHGTASMKGKRCGNEKLTVHDVRAIRASYDREGLNCKILGDIFNVAQNTIYRVVAKQTWKHVV
ncbi:MAG: hypothetical protein GY861_14480 [bacterium]|nr:hypothetical protein [bacterium]